MTALVHKIETEIPGCRYGLGRSLPDDLSAIVERLNSRLQEHGFQVVFRVDYTDRFNTAGIGPFPPYEIWGVSHLEHMRRALSVEPAIGLLLPNHLIVFSNAEGWTVVMLKDPARDFDLLRHPAAIEAVMEIGNLLERIIDEL